MNPTDETPVAPDAVQAPEALPVDPSPAPAAAPVKRKRGRPRKNPPPEDAAAAESAAAPAPESAAAGSSGAEPPVVVPPAPRKRGRPRKNPLPEPAPEPAPEAVASAAPAPADVLPVPEAVPEPEAPTSGPAPASAESIADSIASLFDPSAKPETANGKLETPDRGEAAMEWSPAVQTPDGKPYLPAETTALEQPRGEEWAPPAEPRNGAALPATPAAVDAKRENGKPVPYPADADPAVLAQSVQPSETLKAALAGKHLSNFEMRRLTRRERAYLRAVQHGAKIDYATFVARGIANAQHVAAIQAAQQQGLPKPTFVKPKFQDRQAPPSAAAVPSAVAPAAPVPREDLPEVRVAELQKLDVKALLALAEKAGIADDIPDLHKHDLIYELLRNHARRGGAIRTEGILEIAKDGSGFLRNREANYHTSPEDAQVPPALIRKFGLRPGQLVVGPCRPPENASGKNRFFVLAGIDTVNGLAPNLARRITPFENQTPLFPDKRIVLETTSDGIEMRVTDLFSPIGFGQRGLIVAPPRTGKTVIMQKMANAITQNYPDAYLIILLIDERPEEVTDMQRNTRAHVIASTFDEPPEKHVQVADNVIEMARRKVEMGEDVIILLDSITRLGRAYNTLAPTNGRILSGGVEATALQRPKRFFGSARNLENGGSLTIVATALIETGSRMDEVIFEEFKGTGNMELVLDRALADRRVFPAINIAKSGTRKEELLVNNQIEMTRTWMLRRAIGDAPPAEAMEMIISRMKKFPNNHEFLMGIQN